MKPLERARKCGVNVGMQLRPISSPPNSFPTRVKLVKKLRSPDFFWVESVQDLLLNQSIFHFQLPRTKSSIRVSTRFQNPSHFWLKTQLNLPQSLWKWNIDWFRSRSWTDKRRFYCRVAQDFTSFTRVTYHNHVDWLRGPIRLRKDCNHVSDLGKIHCSVGWFGGFHQRSLLISSILFVWGILSSHNMPYTRLVMQPRSRSA